MYKIKFSILIILDVQFINIIDDYSGVHLLPLFPELFHHSKQKLYTH